MIVTDKLVFLHVPKAAGMFVSKWMQEVFPEASDLTPEGLRQHASLAEVHRALLRGRKVFATIRDPWSWYVSLYHFALSLPGRRRILDGYWDDPDAPSFAGTCRRMVDPVAHGLEPNAWDPPGFGQRETIATMERAGWGLATWWVRSTTQGATPCTLINCDFLHADLRAFLHREHIEVSDEDLDLLKTSPRENVSDHEPWPCFYAADPELYDMIARRDAWMIPFAGWDVDRPARVPVGLGSP